jgi:hypothetical protein
MQKEHTMNQNKRSPHRRKWKRFTIHGGAMVILQKPRLMGFLGQTRLKFGPILNISIGGLAVQYIENKKRMKKYPELSIAITKKQPILDRMPYDVIADYKIAELPDGKIIRNRCVRFQQMTSYHTFQLDDFIRQHSTGFILDRRSGEERRKYNDPRYNDPIWVQKNERRSGIDRRSYPVIL